MIVGLLLYILYHERYVISVSFLAVAYVLSLLAPVSMVMQFYHLARLYIDNHFDTTHVCLMFTGIPLIFILN